MKLGCIYTVFNACELLDGSIDQIYNQLDEIVIVYQNTSNRGNFIKEDDERIINDYLDIKKVHIIEFTPNLKAGTKANELNKHNFGLDYLKKLGCSHFMLSATDHYYKKLDFIYAKQECIKNDYDVTLTSMFTYYKKPTYQLTPIEDYYMPFICKLYPHTQYVTDHWEFRVDPALRLNTKKTMHLFPEKEIMMHHFSMIRDDINHKFNNAAASINWMDKIPAFIKEYDNAKPGDEISYFGGRKLIEVDNYFNIQ